MKNNSLRKMILIFVCLIFLALFLTISINLLVSLGCSISVSGNIVCNLFAQHLDIDDDTLYFGLSKINRLVIFILIFSMLLLDKKNRILVSKNKKKTLAWGIVGLFVLDYLFSILNNRLNSVLINSPQVSNIANQWVVDCKSNILYTPYFIYDPNLKKSGKDSFNYLHLCLTLHNNEIGTYDILGNKVKR